MMATNHDHDGHSFTQWQVQVLDASAAIVWPWPLTFWPQNLISSSSS